MAIAVSHAPQKMLFVDDRSKRIHAALEKYAGIYQVTIAPSAKEALRLLSTETFDVVSLDHDLNGCDFEDPESTGCGMEIVRYIRKTGGWPGEKTRPKIIIHSRNLFAASLMAIELQQLGFETTEEPFQYPKGANMRYDSQGNPIP